MSESNQTPLQGQALAEAAAQAMWSRDHAAQALGVTPAEALMLGDSKSDVKAARAAGFQIVCLSYGYNHGEDIRNENPDAVIDSFLEFEGLLS